MLPLAAVGGLPRSTRLAPPVGASCRLGARSNDHRVQPLRVFRRVHVKGGCLMDWKLELVVIPVTDVDRAKHFYGEQVGFVVDHDTRIDDDMRVVQLTPAGSACSIAIGTGLPS